MSATIDRHIEDISHMLQGIAEALYRPHTTGWLRLPNGDALNMAHAARIVDAGDVPQPMLIICWAIANCQPDDDRVLPETHVYDDNAQHRAWQDETERPDADPEPSDAHDATLYCEGPCHLPTPVDDMWLSPQGERLCFRCYFGTFRLRPLPGGGDA